MAQNEATAVIRELMPLCATLGVRAEEYAADQVVLSLDWSPSLCTANGILHGGAIMALADSAGGACAFLNLPVDAAGTATLESKTNFLATGRAGSATATAPPLPRAATTMVIEPAVRDSKGKLVARLPQPKIVLRK